MQCTSQSKGLKGHSYAKFATFDKHTFKSTRLWLSSKLRNWIHLSKGIHYQWIFSLLIKEEKYIFAVVIKIYPWNVERLKNKYIFIIT